MTLFAIETSTSVCSAAWCIDNQCVAERKQLSGSNHAALLPRFIAELQAEAQPHGWQADAVAVSIGPGSYTGLRIGLSTAKGLCYGWNVPLIPIPTLDILTQSFLTCHLSSIPCHLSPATCHLLPMLDARRMEVYTALYQLTDSPTRPLTNVFAQIVANTDWLPQDGDIYYFGDGAAKCQSVLQGERYHFAEGIVPLASVMGATCQQHQYPLIGEKELAYYTPYYLKEFIAAPSHIKGLK